MITHMQMTAHSKGQGKTLLKMAAAWQAAKCNAQTISGSVSVSLNWQSLLLPRAVLLTARSFHHPLGVGIPDEIFSGATYPFQMFHHRLLSRLLSALPLLVVQGYQCCTYIHTEDVFLHPNKVPVHSEVSSWHNFKKLQYYLCQTAVIAISSLGLRTIYLQMEFEGRKKVIIITVRSSTHLPQKFLLLLQAVE